MQAAELHAVLQKNNKHVAGIHARDRAKCEWRRPRCGLSGSQVAHHAASPTTVVRQPRPCAIQLHSINLTTCMQPRSKFHGIGVAKMQTARATPAGAKSTAAQHTRAEMQQLRSQSHCKQHRSSPNGCSLIATPMQLRLHHCYHCNIVHTTLQLQHYRRNHCACNCDQSASATATATALLRQHFNRNCNSSGYNHAITTIASTITTQVQTQLQTSATLR